MTNTEKCLSLLKIEYQKILDSNLVGIYLHGSYVMGSYNEFVSDLDYVVVVKTPLSLQTKLQLMAETLEKLWPLAPEKGLKFHVLLLADTQHFRQPLPFDFHFSKMHLQNYLNDPTKFVSSMTGTDPDLAAHLTIINHFGKVLTGLPISKVFDQVPEATYWRSILFDVENAQTMILTQPVYTILNLCRALAYHHDHLITSKLTGGQWGLQHLGPASQSLIHQALAAYCRSTPQDSFFASQTELTTFAANLLKKLG